ncbi:MAG: hypothetical protein AB8C84_02955 [Oligoflexales bacterium]
MQLSFLFENESPEVGKVILSGDINEDSEMALGQLKEQLPAKSCTFNFKSVSSINSCGVRAWINFLREAESGRSVTFEECTPEVVSQINMIPNFKGQAKIHSVYAGYFCDSCENHSLQLFQDGTNLPKDMNIDLPDVPCSNCGEVMEMEELEEEFFGWLENA